VGMRTTEGVKPNKGAQSDPEARRGKGYLFKKSLKKPMDCNPWGFLLRGVEG